MASAWLRRLGRNIGIGAGSRPGARPVGVFIVNRDSGAQLPCELSYMGVDGDGLHQWVVGTPFDWRTEMLTIGVLPPRTTITFPTTEPERGEGWVEPWPK